MKISLLALLIGVTLINDSSAQSILAPEALWKLGRVSDPRISADGKVVLYNVRNYNLKENKGNSDIYKINIDGTGISAIASDSTDESAARWSADGKSITYLCDKSGSSQVWAMNPDGSNKRQLTKVEGDISNYAFSGNGLMLWYTTDVKLDKSTIDLYPDLPKTTGRIIDDLMYRHWDTWADGTYSHVFVCKYENGILSQAKDIMKDERHDSPIKPMGGDEQIAFSPDGKMLAYSCKKLSGKEYAISTNSDVYLYNVDNGTTTNLTEGMPGYDMNPAFSPDGSKIIWQSMKTPGYESDRNRLFIYDFKAREKKELTVSYDNNVESASFNHAGDKIYFISGINATEEIFSFDLNPKAKQQIRQITTDVADHTGITIGFNGKEDVIISAMMSISLPTELFKIDLKTGVSKQITFTNKNIFGKISLGQVKQRMVKATDGKDILTWVIYPPNFDSTKKYPALLYCQGGPQGTVSQFFSYRWNFQLMAAKGYIVVAPNRRGLPSFGQKWNDDITEDWGGQAMKDLLSSIDDVAKESYVNKDKLGAVGASFGGYSVYWLAGNHNHRFKAFIAHDGVFNLESMYGGTEEIWFPDHDIGGAYWKNPQPESYKKFSPHLFVNNWNTPILIIHSEKDYRVPVDQGMEAFTAARLHDIPARWLYFPNENHWVTKPQNSVLWQRIFFDWLDKYLK
jgi:dipeptidyl aminopeptidase/acylaminoacyl peptidase